MQLLQLLTPCIICANVGVCASRFCLYEGCLVVLHLYVRMMRSTLKWCSVKPQLHAGTHTLCVCVCFNGLGEKKNPCA